MNEGLKSILKNRTKPYELPIGSRIVFNNVNYIIVEEIDVELNNGCDFCAFDGGSSIDHLICDKVNEIVPCSSNQRSDRKGIIFIRDLLDKSIT